MLARRPGVGQPSQAARNHRRDESFDEIAPEDSLNLSLRRERELPDGLSACIFWSAVGLGAVVKGNPIESVRIILPIAFVSLSFKFFLRRDPRFVSRARFLCCCRAVSSS